MQLCCNCLQINSMAIFRYPVFKSRKPILTEFAMYGASIAPTRAAHEQDPIAAFLTTVGISSAVNMYTMPNAAAAPALPIKASTIVSGWRSEKGIIISFCYCFNACSCVETLFEKVLLNS